MGYDLKIEKGIPVPKERTPGRPQTYPWADMEVGDSILLPGSWKKSKTIGQKGLHHFKQWVKKNHPELDFAYAAEGDDTRVWLCKPERKKRSPNRPRSADIPEDTGVADRSARAVPASVREGIE